MDNKEHRVAEDTIGDYWVSTVKLPVDHGFGGESQWYETYVFPQKDGEVTDWGEKYGERYATLDQAVEGHTRIADALRAGTLTLYEP